MFFSLKTDLIIWIITFTFSNSLMAQEKLTILQPQSFSDQFDQKIQLTENTKWILFSNEKESYEIITDFFKSKKIDKSNNHNGYYIADISRMPRMISNFFAIPEMQKLPYSILLDREEQTKMWPKKDKHFSLIKLNSLQMTEVLFLKDKNDLEKQWLTIESMSIQTNK